MKRAEADAPFVASLYDAATDDEAWQGFAARIAAAIGVEGGVVLLMEGTEVADISLTGNIGSTSPEYQNYYKDLDPWQTNAPRPPDGVVVLSSELYPESELVKTEFYNDFARPIGMMRPLTAYAAIGHGRFMAVGFEQPFAKRLLDVEDKPYLSNLVPHIKQVLALRSSVRALSAKTDFARRGLDALAFGALVADDEGRVLIANSEAEALARSGIGLVLGRGGKLGALLPSEALRLRALVHDAATGGPGGGMRLSTRDGAVGLFVLVTPLPGTFGGETGSGAMVALRRADVSPVVDEKLLMDLFGLSRGQAAVAIAVHAGKSPAEVATERGVRISTVRTQLIEIFARTGACDQRDLIRVIGMLPALKRRDDAAG